MKDYSELKNIKKGIVYIIKTNDKLVKIGISENPYERFKNIESGTGRKIIKWHIIDPIINYKIMEKELHNKFKKYNIGGEWFKVRFSKVVKYTKSINFETRMEEYKNNKNKTIDKIKIKENVDINIYKEFKIDNEGPSDQRVGFRTDKQTKEIIKYICETKGITLSEFMRIAAAREMGIIKK